MPRCRSCGHNNSDNMSFCTKCGQALNNGISEPASDAGGIFSADSAGGLMDFDFGLDFGTGNSAQDSGLSSIGEIKSSLDFGSLDTSLKSGSGTLDAITSLSDSSLAVTIGSNESSLQSDLGANESSLKANLAALDSKINTLGTSTSLDLENAAASLLSPELSAAGTSLKTEVAKALSGEAVKNVSGGARDVQQGVEAVQQGIAKIRQAGAAPLSGKSSLSAKAAAAKARIAAVSAGVGTVVAGAKQIAQGARQSEEGVLQIKRDFSPSAAEAKRLAGQVKAQSGNVKNYLQDKAEDYALSTYQLLDESSRQAFGIENDGSGGKKYNPQVSDTNNASMPASNDFAPKPKDAAPKNPILNLNNVEDVTRLLNTIVSFSSAKQESLSSICEEYRTLLVLENSGASQAMKHEVRAQADAAEKLVKELFRTRQHVYNLLSQFKAQSSGKSLSTGTKRTLQEWIELSGTLNEQFSDQRQKADQLTAWYKSHSTHIRTLLPVGGAAGMAAASAASSTVMNSNDESDDSNTIEINASCIGFIIFLAMMLFVIIGLL